jgi:hypothetical protein
VKLPKVNTQDIQKGVDSANDAAANAVFLGSFDAETRAKITNSNSALMKFAATQSTGYKTTALDDIEKIKKERDSSPEAIAFIEQLKAKFEQGKEKQQTAPPKGSSPSTQLKAGDQNNGDKKPFDSLRPFTRKTS